MFPRLYNSYNISASHLCCSVSGELHFSLRQLPLKTLKWIFHCFLISFGITKPNSKHFIHSLLPTYYKLSKVISLPFWHNEHSCFYRWLKGRSLRIFFRLTGLIREALVKTGAEFGVIVINTKMICVSIFSYFWSWQMTLFAPTYLSLL